MCRLSPCLIPIDIGLEDGADHGRYVKSREACQAFAARLEHDFYAHRYA